MVDISEMKIKDVSLETLKKFLAGKEEETEEFSLETARIEEDSDTVEIYNNQDEWFASIYKKEAIKHSGYFGCFYKKYLPNGYEPRLVDDGNGFINVRLVKKDE